MTDIESANFHDKAMYQDAFLTSESGLYFLLT